MKTVIEIVEGEDNVDEPDDDDDDDDDNDPHIGSLALLNKPSSSQSINTEASTNFIYIGVRYSLENSIAKFDEHKTDQCLGLSFNVDGVPIFDNSRKEFWPIVGRFDQCPPFLIALWYGVGKPLNMNKYLEDFVNDVINLMELGVSIEGKRYTVYLRSGHFDSPARCAVLSTPYYNSRSGCHNCTVLGVWLNGRMCFPDLDSSPRTLDQFHNVYRHKDKNSSSKLLDIVGFDPVRWVLLDSLHVVDLGVTKKLLTERWVPNLRPSDQSRLSSRLESLNKFCPKEFQRRPRPLKDRGFYNGKDFRLLLLYTGPTILQGILSKDQYHHFLFLHVANRILNNEKLIKMPEWLKYARQLLRDFVADYGTIYGVCYMSYNVHALLHLVDDVETTQQTLVAFSSYVYESWLGYLCDLVQSSRLPTEQVARRLHEANIFEVGRGTDPPAKKGVWSRLKNVTLENLPPSLRTGCQYFSKYQTFDSTREPDRFCEVNGSHIIKIHCFVQDSHSELYICGTQMTEVRPLYEVPCRSNIVDILVARLNDGPTCSTLVKNITGKYFHMPSFTNHDQYAFVKLIHCKYLIF